MTNDKAMSHNYDKWMPHPPIQEAAWPSGLGHWCSNPEVLGSRLPPYHYRDLFLDSLEFKSTVMLCK